MLTCSPISSASTWWSPGEASAEQHEPHGLVGAHEVAGHARIGDRDRAAGGDLLAGTWGSRCRGSRARCRSAPSGSRRGRRARARSARPATSTRPSRCVGVGGLVGGDAHELRDVDPRHSVDHVERAEHVGADRLAREVLEHRDVLVRGGVEHDLGPLRGGTPRRSPERSRMSASTTSGSAMPCRS